MSDLYIQRLRLIRDEFEVAHRSLSYVHQNWDGRSLSRVTLFQGIAKESVRPALRNIEVTYFVRLFAEFEGILKEHLGTNHPTVKIPAKPRGCYELFQSAAAFASMRHPNTRKCSPATVSGSLS